jgi:hypothetical protein
VAVLGQPRDNLEPMSPLPPMTTTFVMLNLPRVLNGGLML